MTSKLLYQFDTDATPSVFDSVVGYDGGADHVIGLANITAETVPALVDGAIYTRGPKEKRFTAIFIGGSSLAASEAVMRAVSERFFGKFRVSIMLDSNGCNTTAAAGVALLAKAAPLAGKRAVVLAGTGPVGMRAAALLALEGAAVAITGRQINKTQAAAAAIEARFGVTVEAIAAPDSAARGAAVRNASIVFAAGAAGQNLLEEAHWKGERSVEFVADLNPQPPLGLAGMDPMDKGRDYDGKLAFGALGIGGLKLKLHRACVAQLFESHDKVFDAHEIYKLAAGDGVMAMKDDSVETFLTELASKAATPGGGSAAAVMGGIAAALSSMVCNLTIGKKKFVEIEAEMKDVLERADSLRARMVYAIEEDVAAFSELMAAYGLPKATEAEQRDRAAAIQASLHGATDAPLACARLCREAIDLAAIVSAKGNPSVISDGGVAVLAAHAALRSAALNVYVNAKAIEDRAFAGDRLRILDGMLKGAGEKTEAVYDDVKQRLV